MNEVYKSQVKKIREDIDNVRITDSIAWYRRFALFSTNLGLMLPDLPFSEHQKLFKKTVINQHLSFLDEAFQHIVPHKWRDGNELDWDNLNQQPSIVVTYHTGSYRLLSYLLLRYGVSVALLLSRDVLNKQGASMVERMNSLDYNVNLQLIDAENPRAGLRLIRALRDGYTVMAYLDGNTGTAIRAGNDNLLVLDFLGGRIKVRKGLAYLAERASVPLRSVLPVRKTGRYVELWLNRDYCPKQDMNGNNFVENATRSLYTDLAQIIKKEPWQWDQWFFLHESMLSPN